MRRERSYRSYEAIVKREKTVLGKMTVAIDKITTADTGGGDAERFGELEVLMCEVALRHK